MTPRQNVFAGMALACCGVTAVLCLLAIFTNSLEMAGTAGAWLVGALIWFVVLGVSIFKSRGSEE